MSIWQIIRTIICRHQWETIGNIQRCKKCGVEITMDELTEAIAKRWDKMFGHLEEELKEFDAFDKRVKDDIEKHREQMRNWNRDCFAGMLINTANGRTQNRRYGRGEGWKHGRSFSLSLVG